MLHLDDLFEFVDLVAHIRGATLGILIQQFHLIQLLVHRRHHLQHHPSVLIEHILFDVGRAFLPRGSALHHVVDDLANLSLIVFKHIDLAVHHGCLPVDEALWHLVCVLLSQEVLPHFVDEGCHLLLLICCHFLHLVSLHAKHRRAGRLGIVAVLSDLSLLSCQRLGLLLLHLLSIRHWFGHNGLISVGCCPKQLRLQVLFPQRELLPVDYTGIMRNFGHYLIEF